jgi:hypothetical protein
MNTMGMSHHSRRLHRKTRTCPAVPRLADIVFTAARTLVFGSLQAAVAAEYIRAGSHQL